MNAMDKWTREEEPTLRAVEISEMRAITGGDFGGLGGPGGYAGPSLSANLNFTSLTQQILSSIGQLLQSGLVPNHGSHGFK
jgi:hypothetical protein